MNANNPLTFLWFNNKIRTSWQLSFRINFLNKTALVVTPRQEIYPKMNLTSDTNVVRGPGRTGSAVFFASAFLQFSARSGEVATIPCRMVLVVRPPELLICGR